MHLAQPPNNTTLQSARGGLGHNSGAGAAPGPPPASCFACAHWRVRAECHALVSHAQGRTSTFPHAHCGRTEMPSMVVCCLAPCDLAELPQHEGQRWRGAKTRPSISSTYVHPKDITRGLGRSCTGAAGRGNVQVDCWVGRKLERRLPASAGARGRETSCCPSSLPPSPQVSPPQTDRHLRLFLCLSCFLSCKLHPGRLGRLPTAWPQAQCWALSFPWVEGQAGPGLPPPPVPAPLPTRAGSCFLLGRV